MRRVITGFNATNAAQGQRLGLRLTHPVIIKSDREMVKRNFSTCRLSSIMPVMRKY